MVEARARCGGGCVNLPRSQGLTREFQHRPIRLHRPSVMEGRRNNPRSDMRADKETSLAASASPSLAAERYAQALFELAKDEGSLDAVAADLDAIVKLIAGNTEFARLVNSPVINRDQKAAAMAEILETAGAAKLTRNFIGLVARNRRLFLLPHIGRGFTRLLAKHRGEINADVKTAHALNDAQLADLKATLKAAYGKEPLLNVTVDPSLLAGLVVKVGSKMIDSSLKTKLNALKTVLTEA
jgi:F-type H+-transporting ATPase subunit delta